MATKRGAFSGRRLDDHAVLVFDGDSDITEAAMSHPHTANPLFREAIVQGNNLVVQYVPNRSHGLTPLQVGISTTKHGPCKVLTPTNQSITYNSNGERVISCEAYEAWKVSHSAGLFTVELVPSVEEVRESLATVALDGDISDVELFEEVKDSISPEVLNRYPHLERGPLIVNEALKGIDESMLLDLEEDELTEMLRLANEQGQTAVAQLIEKFLGKDGPTPQLQKVLGEVRVITDQLDKLERELEHAQEWERVADEENIRVAMDDLDEKLDEKVELINELSDALKGQPPVERPNWGIPSLVFNAYNILNRMTVQREVDGVMVTEPSKNVALARRRFVGFVEEAELTCVQVADMAIAEYGNDIPLLRKAGEKRLTYELVTQAIQDEERRYARELESWANGSDAVSRSMNMGNLVHGLISWEEDKDARPRPEMCEEPVSEDALGDFEMEALQRDLSKKSTPRDSEQWMGELAEWSADVPYIQTESASPGHPFAWLIAGVLNGLSQEHDVTQVIDEDGDRLFEERVEVVRLLGVTVDGREGNQWTTTIGSATGTILDANGDSSVVLLKEPGEEFGFVYKVRSDDNWCIGTPKDDGGMWAVDDTVGFASRLGFLSWRASFVTVPTLEFNEDGTVVIDQGYDGLYVPITWKPLVEVFPALCDFILWAQDEYETGAGLIQASLDDDMGEKLWELQAELSQYQERMMQALVEANISVHFVPFTEELQNAWEMYGEDSNIASMRFEDTEGRPTSLYGRLSNVLWACASSLTGETVIAPRPMRVTGVKLSDDLEQEVKMWGVNETMLWRAMGYSLHPSRYRQNMAGLANMVRERIVRSNPVDVASRTEWWRNPVTGKSHRRQVHKRLVTWTDEGAWNVGVLGDALAEWWTQAVGIHLPAVKGNILALDEATVVERLGWTPNMARRLVSLSKVWGRSKELRNGGLEKLIEMLLPMPSDKNPEQYAEVFKMRLQLQSASPLLTGELVDTALLLIDGAEQERRVFIAAMKAGVDEVGVSVVRALTELIG